MKKLYVLLLLVAGSVGLVQAQNDPNAKKILDGVSAKLKTFKGVTANFTYITKDKKNAKKNAVNGNISIKGQKYYIKQGATEIFCNGAQTWNFNGENEVTVTPVDNDSKSLSPNKILSDAFYDKDYSYKLVSAAGTYNEILLTPVDKRKNFKQVTVYVDKVKSMITKAAVLDKSDNTIEFVLSNVNTNAALADNKFEFDPKKHPGVEVIQ
ncbi:LolA family protein [Deminuibacter soli]|uniref:Outer membrane lipoprotein carrier protein LolA n=1 Tax=Deminuibacter soli TaxID=2291815 RepID=A0A3E1NEU0_9BACT|nr:outer membrane lipoprotein carrier protein LolA [Deminuibacter soli]RFM26321.1 outer membrane lipoprotein carrier protein LolA [Deminuibacter soli]